MLILRLRVSWIKIDFHNDALSLPSDWWILSLAPIGWGQLDQLKSSIKNEIICLDYSFGYNITFPNREFRSRSVDGLYLKSKRIFNWESFHEVSEKMTIGRSPMAWSL